MNIAVVVKQVPDLAEELEIGDDGASLSTEYLTWVLNEYDDHALEEALHLKEATGGKVTVLGLGTETIDEALFTCLAKGADAAVKVGAFEGHVDSHTAARALAAALEGIPHDLVLTGVQAIDDVDGQVGPLLATRLGIPHVSVVTHIAPSGDGALTVNQEYAGGMGAEFDVELPALLGVQAARELPRYAPVSRVRQMMKTATLDTVDVSADGGSGITIRSMAVPESGGQAEMIDGDADAVVERLFGLMAERGLIGG